MAFSEATSKHKESPRNVACFFFLGLQCLIFDEMVIIAAEDVLAGSKLATSSIILSIALPLLVIKLTAPWILQGFSHLKRVVLVVVIFVAGLIIVVFSPHISARLLGVSVTEAAVALSEITFLSLTAFYEEISLSAFVAGIGMASLLGPLYYTGMTTWLCVSPKTTMMSSVPWPLLFFLLYALLDKEPLTRTQGSVTNEDKRVTNSPIDSAEDRNTDSNIEEDQACSNDIHGSKVPSDDSDRSVILDPNHEGPTKRCPELKGRETDLDADPKQHDQAPNGALTWREKVSGAKEISPYIFYLFITYLAEYLSNHAVITTIAFPSSKFSPRDHYPYYLLSYHVGKFLGRSHFFVICSFFPTVFPYISIKRTWTLALIQVLHLVFFFLVAWYRFVTEAWVIILLCLTEGFTAGSMYVNSAYTVSEKISTPGLREFALCILTVGNAFGKLTAGFLGLFQEPLIRKHCLHELGLGEYCFTRHSHHSAWEQARDCGSII